MGNETSFFRFCYSIFLLNLVALVCFIQIIGYILSYILIQNIEYKNKFPILSKFLDRFKKMGLIYLSIEVILCFICLMLIFLFSLFYLYSGNI